MPAYKEYYLDDAMQNLAEACDYAVDRLGLSLDMFLRLFVGTEYAGWFEHGVPNIICGISGMDLALKVLDRVGYPIPDTIQHEWVEYECSPEYWCGWILAYTQWKLNCSFRDLLDCVSAERLLQLYSPLHEAAEDKTCQNLEKKLRERKMVNRLQEYRERHAKAVPALLGR